MTEFPDYSFTYRGVKATLTYIGEGEYGDYDPKSVDDAPLYRLDLTRIGVEYETDGGSYCTCIQAGLPGVKYREIAKRIAMYAHNLRQQGLSLDKIAQMASWFAKNASGEDFTDAWGNAA